MKKENGVHLFNVMIVLSFIISACSGSTPTATPPATSAVLSEVHGQVTIKNIGEMDSSPAIDGMILDVEGEIITGADGRARLDLSTGTVIRLAPNTTFALTANEAEAEGLLTRIKLEAGRIWIALQGGSMAVDTPSGLASVRGSNLMVWVDPGTQNVYVSCFEGLCGAENTDHYLGLQTGDGAVLYHVETGENLPPPGYFSLTWEDFEDWAENNPEVMDILPSIVQTLTAIPNPPEIPLPTITATATPSCFSLLTPIDGASLPDVGSVNFTWSTQPDTVLYRVDFISPSGALNSLTTPDTSLLRYIESLTVGGTYTWQVTALNSAGGVLCTAGPYTFDKPGSPTPSIPFGQGNAVFNYEIGPKGYQNDCYTDKFFSVSVTDPNGIQNAYVYYQVGYGQTGSFALKQVGANEWQGSYPFAYYYEQTVLWWFSVVDGQNNYETSSHLFQFICGGGN